MKSAFPSRLFACLLFASLIVAAESAHADTLWGRLFGPGSCPHCAGVCRDDHHRAGHPERIAWYARPRGSNRYGGYYVGGGAAVKGDPRGVHEGVWGWDYVGHLLRPRVNLNWWHGRKYQGGPGAYKTDGPHLRRHE